MENKILKKLFEEDQKDRASIKNTKTYMSWLTRRDTERRKTLEKTIKKKLIKTPKDYFFAAMILHHSGSIAYTKKARNLAKKSMLLGFKKSKWLYAAATDRILTMQNKKQKFGTQYFQKKNGKYELFPVNEKISDKERRKFDVMPLKKMIEKIEKLNRNS